MGEREKYDPFDKGEILSDLYERLYDLFDLEEKGWQVDSAIEEIQKQIHSLLHECKEERLKDLKQIASQLPPAKVGGLSLPIKARRLAG